MAINTSIITNGMRHVEMESPVNALAKILQVQEAQQGQQMNALKMDEYRSGLQEKNALADLYKGAYGADGKLDRAAILRGAADRGLGAKIPTLQKGFADEDKTAADTQKAQIEAHLKKFEVAGQIVAGVRDQATWELARQQTEQVFGAEAAAQMPAQYDPALIEQKRLQAMTVKEQLEQEHKRLTLAETQRHHKTTEGLTAQGQRITMRGQDMTDARSRELNANGKEIAAAAKKEAATEKDVTKFSATLQKEGIPELETAVSGAEGALGRYKPGTVPGIGPIKNAMPAFAMSAEGKDVRQALAQVRNIVLSARSGAAVTDQELRRLVEEIGTGVGMSEDDIRKGLTKIRARIDAIKTNAAAGVNDEVLKTYQDRGGISIKRGGASPAPPGAPVKLDAANADSEYEKLPSGAEFIAPDGSRRRKP